jgi:hypothetical protein
MQTLTAPFHGKRTPRLSSWQQEQTAKQAYAKTTFRQPSFYLYKDDPKHRAIVTVYLTLVDNLLQANSINVVLTHHRTERRYNHISLASLRRLSSIAPLPLLTDEQFTAINEALVADEMLNAAKEQADRKPELHTKKGFRLIDRFDAAIQIGTLHELTGIEGKAELEAA